MWYLVNENYEFLLQYIKTNWCIKLFLRLQTTILYFVIVIWNENWRIVCPRVITLQCVVNMTYCCVVYVYSINSIMSYNLQSRVCRIFAITLLLQPKNNNKLDIFTFSFLVTDSHFVMMGFYCTRECEYQINLSKTATNNWGNCRVAKR